MTPPPPIITSDEYERGRKALRNALEISATPIRFKLNGYGVQMSIPTDLGEESWMEKLYRHRLARREAAVRRLVERVLGHAVPADLEELAALALQDMGVRIEVVISNCHERQNTAFAHRGSTCIDSEPVDSRRVRPQAMEDPAMNQLPRSVTQLDI